MSDGWPERDRGIFVDTAVWFALSDDRDARRSNLERIQQQLFLQRQTLITTNFVIAETHALMVGKLGIAPALRFLDRIRESETHVVRVDENDDARARTILFRYTDKDFSYTDATSFAVMERFGITTAFTLDRHFLQYGFRVLGLED